MVGVISNLALTRVSLTRVSVNSMRFRVSVGGRGLLAFSARMGVVGRFVGGGGA